MRRLWMSIVFLGLMQSVSAAEVVVKVTGIPSTEGQVGCLLFNRPDGFPKKVDKAFVKQGQPAAATVTCIFDGLVAGTYAVAVSHDKNENQKIDTNFLGVPKEAWGVSNNIRFKLRPPKFEEAQFSLTEDQQKTLSIEVAK